MNAPQRILLALTAASLFAPGAHAINLAEAASLCRGNGGAESLDCAEAKLGKWSAPVVAVCTTDPTLTLTAAPVEDDSPAAVAARLPDAITQALNTLIPQCPLPSDGSTLVAGTWTTTRCGDEIWHGPVGDGRAASKSPDGSDCLSVFRNGVFHSRQAITAPIACPQGYVPVGSSRSGTPLTDSQPFACARDTDLSSLGQPNACSAFGDPMDAGTGNQYEVEFDYRDATGLLSFVRHYNSSAPSGKELGVSWTTPWFNQRVGVEFTGSAYQVVRVYRNDGRALSYRLVNGVLTPQPGVTDLLARQPDGSWHFTELASGNVEHYGTDGRLHTLTDRNGNTITLTHDAAGRIARITDPTGRFVTFAYNTDGRLAAFYDPANAATRYTYNARGNLAGVTYPDGSTRGYLYEDPSFSYLLTGIVDATGQRHLTIEYAAGKVKRSYLGNGAQAITAAYTGGQGSDSVVNDGMGLTTRLQFQLTGQGALPSERTEIDTASGLTLRTRSFTYDAAGNRLSTIDGRGITTTYTYNARNLETSRVRAGRTISTDWHPIRALPTAIAEPLKITRYSYDANGNLLTRTEQATTDPDGSQGLTVTPSGPSGPSGRSRTWNYHYNGQGKVIRIDGPRTDVAEVTSFTYDAHGNLATATNPAGHITTYADYTAGGRARRITDPNGVITTLAYDARERLTETRRFASANPGAAAITRYSYDANGNLARVDLPDGRFTTYAYDTAHRLIGSTDHLGNRTAYQLDAAGNPVATETTDTGGSTVFRQYRVHNPLNQLAAIYRSDQHLLHSTVYDGNGNPLQIADANNAVTQYEYSASGLPTKIIDPQRNNYFLDYDGQDQLTRVTTPRVSREPAFYPQFPRTEYVNTGLGDRLQTTTLLNGMMNIGGFGPQSTTRYTYNDAGQLTRVLDPRGLTATYAYDTLGRPATLNYHYVTYDTVKGKQVSSIVPQSASITWDTVKAGLPSSIVDPSGTTEFGYDELGRVNLFRHTPPAPAKGKNTVVPITSRYAYDAADRITSLTLPSGRVVSYQYANGELAAIQVGATTLVDQVTWNENGTLRGWRYNGSQVYLRSRNADGLVSGVSSPPFAKTYAYDARQLLTQASDQRGGPSQSYSYDALGRLTASLRGTTRWDYAYDANGNRTSTQVNGMASSYRYQSVDDYDTHDLLLSAGPEQFRADEAGNLGFVTTGVGSVSNAFDSLGRVVSSTSSVQSGRKVVETTTNFAYTANGRRVAKGDTRLAHDPSGRLIGEYAANGTMVREYVYLGNEPVAMITPTTSYFIQPDHLGTPRTMTDAANAVVWRWEGEPFGDDPPTGTVELNLRFPGQYFDAETGLFYNNARYYHPGIGRYISPDPIGLAGGFNVYAYVNENPVSFADPDGLTPSKPLSGQGNAALSLQPNWGPAPTNGYIGATGDFLMNYSNMRSANTIGADKYFHCKANCEATKRGKEGQQMACAISDGREWFDQNIKGDPASASAADQAANQYGRSQGASSSQSCSQICSPYRPNGLPTRY